MMIERIFVFSDKKSLTMDGMGETVGFVRDSTLLHPCVDCVEQLCLHPNDQIWQ
jgi:hypothetical protein